MAMPTMEMLMTGAMEAMVRQMAMGLMVASVGAALLLTAAWLVAGIVRPAR